MSWNVKKYGFYERGRIAKAKEDGQEYRMELSTVDAAITSDFFWAYTCSLRALGPRPRGALRLVDKARVTEIGQQTTDMGKEALSRRGVAFHKDVNGLNVLPLGYELAPEGFGARIAGNKRWVALESTEGIIRTRRASSQRLAAVVSFWPWAQQV